MINYINYIVCIEACHMPCGKYCAAEIELVGNLIVFTPYENGEYKDYRL